MGTESTRDWLASPLTKRPTPPHHANQPPPGNTHGSHIITGFLIFQSLHEYQFATHRLLGKLTPDFKTIADFRKDNFKPLWAVARQFSPLCRKLELFGGELLAY